MDIEPRLLIHNTGFIVGAIFNFCLTFFVVYKTRGRFFAQALIFILMTIGIIVFETAHLVGVNVQDPYGSRTVLMFTLVLVPIGILFAHWILLLTEKAKEKRISLAIVYISGFLLLLFYLINPDYYLLPSEPKMYFPQYYEPGIAHWFVHIWFMMVGLYYLYHLFVSYFEDDEPFRRNRLKYVFISIAHAFIFGSAYILLVYDIQFDPVWSALFGLYTLPLAYAFVQYEVMAVKVVAKRAIIYAGVVMLITVFITFISYLNNIFIGSGSVIGPWVIPFVASLVTAGLGGLIYHHAQQSARLKYEFITVVTHKFRTPLTRIRWGAQTLRDPNMPTEKKQMLQHIEQATHSLLDLTNLMVGLSDTESNKYDFHQEKVDFVKFVKEVAASYIPIMHEEEQKLELHIEPAYSYTNIDVTRMRFALQIIIDNAIKYTPKRGLISITVRQDDARDRVICRVSDSGIGIPKDELPYIFTKFYRGKSAKKRRTEGMGVGLTMARNTIRNHGGDIWPESEGEGKGSSFVFYLPIVSDEVKQQQSSDESTATPSN